MCQIDPHELEFEVSNEEPEVDQEEVEEVEEQEQDEIEEEKPVKVEVSN